jgi:serine/threonine-protein kinase ULK4
VVSLIESPKIEGHLNDLYNSISSPSSSVAERVNALLYFESIIVNSSVSNRLINSAFMNLLVKMLKTIKTPQVRVRVCSVIGLLVRHSTVIENDVAESEVCSQLVEVLMRDKNEKVRRKAVAALGEYMFYAAT